MDRAKLVFKERKIKSSYRNCLDSIQEHAVRMAISSSNKNSTLRGGLKNTKHPSIQALSNLFRDVPIISISLPER